MESELGISASSIYRILTENLGYIKVCAKFVPLSLKPHEKDLRIFDYLTNVDAIQKVSNAIPNAIPKDDLKKSIYNLLDRANRCIQCEGDYFESDQ